MLVVLPAPASAVVSKALRGASPGYIASAGPALTPLGFTQFCHSNPDQCAEGEVASDSATGKKIEARLAELDQVNRRVNRAIVPKADDPGLINDIWRIGPSAGDCDDYAVTKRAKLLAQGWSPRLLLLSQVQTRGGEPHLVLVARTQVGDFVLDNLSDRVLPASKVSHRWSAIQSSDSPQMWNKAVFRPSSI